MRDHAINAQRLGTIQRLVVAHLQAQGGRAHFHAEMTSEHLRGYNTDQVEQAIDRLRERKIVSGRFGWWVTLEKDITLEI